MSIEERKKREREKRKNEILTAAHQVFSAKGLKYSRVEEIASRAELSPSTLYLYFKSKEDIYTVLSINLLKHITMGIHKLLKQDISAREKLEGVYSVFLNTYYYDKKMLTNLLRLQSEPSLNYISETTLLEFKQQMSRAYNAIIHIINEGIESGFLMDVCPAHMADMLWMSYTGVVLWKNSTPVSKGADNRVCTCLETAFHIIIQTYKREESHIRSDEPVCNPA